MIRVRFDSNVMAEGRFFQADREYIIPKSMRSYVERCGEILEDLRPEPVERKDGKLITYLDWPPVNDILVVKSYGLGNAIDCTPIISALWINTAMKSRIDVCVRDDLKPLFKGHPFIKRVYGHKEVPRSNRYGAIINGTPTNIDAGKLAQGPVFAADSAWVQQMSEVDANLNILDTIGPKVLTGGPNTWAMWEKPLTIDNPAYFVVCAGYAKGAGLTWQMKDWGAVRWAEAVSGLLAGFPEAVAVVVGVDGEDEFVSKMSTKDRKRVVNLIGTRMSLLQVSGVIRYGRLMVCNDTGLGHVAAAHGVQVYVVTGPTKPLKVNPWKYGECITSPRDCSPCQYTKRWTTCHNKAAPVPCMVDLKADAFVNRVLNAETAWKKSKRFELAIVMTVCDRVDLLQATLASLAACHGMGDVRVVIVDDASTDERVAEVIGQFKKVCKNAKHVRLPARNGRSAYAETINSGVAEASAEYIMFLPADCIVNPWLIKAAIKLKHIITKDAVSVSFFYDSRYGDPDKLVKEGCFFRLDEIDGFGVMVNADTFRHYRFYQQSRPWSSGTWKTFYVDMIGRGCYNLIYKEGLIEHIGNGVSEMNPVSRAKCRIESRGDVLNLYRKPKILED